MVTAPVESQAHALICSDFFSGPVNQAYRCLLTNSARIGGLGTPFISLPLSCLEREYQSISAKLVLVDSHQSAWSSCSDVGRVISLCAFSTFLSGVIGGPSPDTALLLVTIFFVRNETERQWGLQELCTCNTNCKW